MMNTFLKSALLLLAFTAIVVNAQTQTSYNSKPIIKVSADEMSRTGQDWMAIQKVTPDYPLYFRIKVDTTKWAEDFNGWKFFETKIRFGIKDGANTACYELPYTFHGAKRTGVRTHLLAVTGGKFFIYAYDLDGKEHINHILFIFDPQTNKLESQVLSQDYYMGYYPRFYVENDNRNDEISQLDDNLKLNFSTDQLEKFDLEKTGDRSLSLLLINNTDRQRFKYTVWENNAPNNTPAKEPKMITDYSNDKDEQLYANQRNKINATEPLITFNYPNYVYKQLHGRTIKAAPAYTARAIVKNIAEIESYRSNELLVRPFDPEGRYTTPLFIYYCYDKSKIITDNLNRKFSETTIRFGFKNENTYYELPYKFYIEYIDKPRDTNPQVPQMIYANNKFYIFTQDFIDNRLNYSLVTCDDNGNVKRDLLFDDENLGKYAFFNKSEKHGFALNHYHGKNQLMLQTFLENGYWKTEIKYKIQIPAEWAAHAQNYICTPFFLNPQAEPYNPVYETTDKGRVLKTGYNNTCIATTDDAKLLAEYKVLQAGHDKLFASADVYNFTYSELDDRKIGYSFPAITTVYKPENRTTMLIPNMPKIHDQAGFASCMAYALGAILQQNIFTYEQYYNNNIIDRDNVPAKFDISYFGMQIFTRGNKRREDEEADRFDFEHRFIRGNVNTGEDYNDLNIGYEKKGFFYTNQCNNLDNIPLLMRYPLKFNNRTWEKEYEENLDYFNKIYTNYHPLIGSASPSTFTAVLNDLSQKFGVPASEIALVPALKQDDYNKFLKTLFFTCDNGKYSFPSYLHFSQQDVSGLSKTAQKQMIINILSQGKPVIFTHFANLGSTGAHDAVICGYKKVADPVTGVKKDVFKVQNSWGKPWQYGNVDGWMDADVIVQSLVTNQQMNNITYIDSHLSNENSNIYTENVILDRLVSDVR